MPSHDHSFRNVASRERLNGPGGADLTWLYDGGFRTSPAG